MRRWRPSARRRHAAASVRYAHGGSDRRLSMPKSRSFSLRTQSRSSHGLINGAAGLASADSLRMWPSTRARSGVPWRRQ